MKYLAKGEFFQELCRLVGLAKLEVFGHSQLGPAVLGSNLSLLSTEVIRVGEQSPSNHAVRQLYRKGRLELSANIQSQGNPESESK